MTPDPALQAALLDDPQPLLGGTLWLMTRFHEAPCPVLARRIVDNLERLAGHDFCGGPLRAACATLRAQWAARCLRAQLGLERASAGDGARDAGVDGAPRTVGTGRPQPAAATGPDDDGVSAPAARRLH
jgi:hypothetical protein